MVALNENSDQLLLDLTGVEYLSSAGLCVILNVGKRLQERQGRLVICVRTGPVRQVMNLAGFDQMFSLCDSFAQGSSYLTGHPLLDITHSGTVCVVSAAGRIDAERVPEFETNWQRLLQQGETHIALDLSKLDYLSSAGLCSILNLGKRLKASQGKLAIYAIPGPLRRVLEVSGFPQMFPLCGSFDETVWGAQ